jgi:hypothetical protein
MANANEPAGGRGQGRRGSRTPLVPVPGPSGPAGPTADIRSSRTHPRIHTPTISAATARDHPNTWSKTPPVRTTATKSSVNKTARRPPVTTTPKAGTRSITCGGRERLRRQRPRRAELTSASENGLDIKRPSSRPSPQAHRERACCRQSRSTPLSSHFRPLTPTVQDPWTSWPPWTRKRPMTSPPGRHPWTSRHPVRCRGGHLRGRCRGHHPTRPMRSPEDARLRHLPHEGHPASSAASPPSIREPPASPRRLAPSGLFSLRESSRRGTLARSCPLSLAGRL